MSESTFTRIQQDLESDGSGGISSELRSEGEKSREVWIEKLVSGKCRSMESYADAVGYVRGLNLFLEYAERKAQKASAELATERLNAEED